MSNAGVLHIFCGKIGSGKSTLAVALSAAPGTILLSEDELLTRLYPGEIQTLEDYARSAKRIREALTDHIRSLLCEGLDVVLDFQANTAQFRKWVRRILESTDAEHRLHHLDAPDELCRSRLAARNAAGTHPYQVSEAEFQQFNSYFVPPAPEEGFNVVLHPQR